MFFPISKCNILYLIITVNPTFQLNTTTEGTVLFVPGSRITIQCIVKGFPESNINWESGIRNFAHNTTYSKTPLKNEYTTTSIFTLDSPASNHSGKNVKCLVMPQYGTELQRRFTLKLKHSKEIYYFFSSCCPLFRKRSNW